MSSGVPPWRKRGKIPPQVQRFDMLMRDKVESQDQAVLWGQLTSDQRGEIVRAAREWAEYGLRQSRSLRFMGKALLESMQELYRG